MMSMLNQAAVEALCSATYLENYLDCMENLPDDLQRNVSQLRELDSKSNELVSDMTTNQHTYLTETDSHMRKRALIQIQRALIKSQEIGDEKLALVSQIMEHIENRTRQLEQDLENLDPGTTATNEPEEVRTATQKTSASTNVKNNNKVIEQDKPEKTSSKRQRRQRTATETKEEDKKPKQLIQRSMSVDSPGPSAKTVRLVLGEEKEKPKKKKKRKAKKEKEGERSPIPEPIDPDEPTYCLCEQVSYGEMIGCDNDDCPIEWFHFNCVNLTNKPKGKWYCPKCRGDKPNVRRQEK